MNDFNKLHKCENARSLGHSKTNRIEARRHDNVLI